MMTMIRWWRGVPTDGSDDDGGGGSGGNSEGHSEGKNENRPGLKSTSDCCPIGALEAQTAPRLEDGQDLVTVALQ